VVKPEVAAAAPQLGPPIKGEAQRLDEEAVHVKVAGLALAATTARSAQQEQVIEAH
jgi:hypothetical protein